MKTKILSALGVVVVCLIGFYFVNQLELEEVVGESRDYKNTSYLIEGVSVELKDGYAESGSDVGVSANTVTSYFGNELYTDLDGDGDDDVAFVLTQETGGSGVFYYAVAAINNNGDYVGSDAYLLGDRISPQSTDLSTQGKHKNVVVFNFFDRSEGDAMTDDVSVGKSVYLKLNPESMRWGIVMPDFEGESAL